LSGRRGHLAQRTVENAMGDDARLRGKGTYTAVYSREADGSSSVRFALV